MMKLNLFFSCNDGWDCGCGCNSSCGSGSRRIYINSVKCTTGATGPKGDTGATGPAGATARVL